jgi:hypothetical protein
LKLAAAACAWATTVLAAPPQAHATDLGVGLETSARATQPDEGDEGIAAQDLDPADLRTGHFLISLGGGLSVPTSALVPALPEFGELSLGGGAQAKVAWGLNRHLSLAIDGGYTYFGADNSCSACSAAVVDVGAGLTYHIAQGFALDPWISYGVGYRHIQLTLPTDSGNGTAAGVVGNRVLDGLDVARLALGGDYYPQPSIGFGPYLGASIGLRDDESTVLYGVFQAGMRITFDPMRSGAQLTPNVAGL